MNGKCPACGAALPASATPNDCGLCRGTGYTAETDEFGRMYKRVKCPRCTADQPPAAPAPEPLIVAKECAERGCCAHDPRIDGAGVLFHPAAPASAALPASLVEGAFSEGYERGYCDAEFARADVLKAWDGSAAKNELYRRTSVQPFASRSVQRRIALQKGEPMPTFDGDIDTTKE